MLFMKVRSLGIHAVTSKPGCVEEWIYLRKSITIFLYPLLLYPSHIRSSFLAKCQNEVSERKLDGT
jgi:hypothetical protein